MNHHADERLAWLYQENPLGSAWTWLAAENGSDTVIGCGTVFPLNRYIQGRVVRTGVTIDFAVEKKHRMAGAALAIQRAVAGGSHSAGFNYLTGRPNRKAIPIFERVGYQTIGETRNWVKLITRCDEPPERSNSLPYTDEVVHVADERFNQLWDVGRSRYQIVEEKTALLLNWRYRGFQEQDYRFYCLLNRGDGRLLGYVVFYTWGKGFVIADFFCECREGSILDHLVLGFACRARMEGKEWIGLSYLGAPSFESHLSRLGFTLGKHRRKLLVYVDPCLPTKFRNQIFEKNNWFLFGGETDLF